MPNDITLTLTSTSCQIVLSYTAPDASACTIEVSEDASYSPVVNDVNNSLFSGSNSDDRTGSLGAGTTSRQVLIGTVQNPAGTLSNLAGDSKRYGRALHPTTIHYIRVTCGTHTGTGSIATKNIPLGITRPSEQPMASAGVYAFPTVDETNRTQTIRDPVTGILLRKLATPTDDSTGGQLTFHASGAPWVSSQSTLNDSSGTPGYIVVFPKINGPAELYFVTETASRYLGAPHLYGGVITDFGSATFFPGSNPAFGTNPRELFYVMSDGSGEGHVLKCQLPASGDTWYDTSHADGTDAPCNFSNSSDLTPNPSTLTDQLVAFDATFDPSKFSMGANQYVQGNYLVFSCLRGNQDSYGWIGAVDLTTNPVTVAAFMPLWQRGGANDKSFRWCGIHTSHPALGAGGKLSFTAKTGYQDIKGSYFTTTLSGAMNNSQTTITFASNTPLGNDGSGHTENIGYGIGVGDQIVVDSEQMVIGSFVSGTTWNVSRAQFNSSINSHSSGAVVLMSCACHQPGDVTQVGPSWWDIVADPHGNDTTGSNLITQLGNANVYSGHEGFANGRGIAETGYAAFVGPEMTNNSAFVILDSPSFAGANKTASGNAWQKHDAPPQQTSADSTQSLVWGLDAPACDADPEISPTSLTNVSGSLWKFTNTNYWANGAAVLATRKKLAMLSLVGAKPLLDISSTATGDVIGTTSGDNYKYCVANAVNECRTGSAVGDIYVNAPSITGSSTAYGAWDYSNVTGIAIGHIPAIGSAIIQIGIVEANSTGKWFRTLTTGLQPVKIMNTSSDSHALPNGRWVTFPMLAPSGNWHIMLAKAPAWPGYDGIDRNTFYQKPVTVPAIGGATEAFIEFGYDTNFYCTSRNEICISAASNNPYWFASESFTAVSCGSGCTINIPVIPNRVVYYRIKWRDSGHTVVQTSDAYLLAEDSAPAGSASVVTGPSVKLIAMCT